jgi:hypothetical protein
MANEYKLSFKAEDIDKKLSVISTPDTRIPGEIKPKFADNTWEVIKWVSQYDDPSKYWKVGDYKMLDYPEVTRPGSISNPTYQSYIYFLKNSSSDPRPTSSSLGYFKLENPSKVSRMIYNTYGNQYTGSGYYYRVFAEWSHPNEPADETKTKVFYLGITTSASTSSNIIRVTENMNLEELSEELGIVLVKNTTNWSTYATDYNINKYGLHGNSGWNYNAGKVYPATKYPIMILGFNHDNVSDVGSYGKQKAGMTLSLGISRGANIPDGKRPPYNWTEEEGNILPNLYESGVSHFESAIDDDTLMSPYCKGDGTNWMNSEFRATLQHLLDGTELEDKLVAVDKCTGEGKYRSDINYFSNEISSDKITLPSEFEIHGMVKYSCAQEGDWYDFFKRGNSRFFWDSRMCGKEEFTILRYIDRIGNPLDTNLIDKLALINWIKEHEWEYANISLEYEYTGGADIYRVYVYDASYKCIFNEDSIDLYRKFLPNSFDAEAKFVYQKASTKASQLLLWSRSPRADQSTDPLKTKGACILYNGDVLAITGETTSGAGVKINNAKTLINAIKALDYSERNYYGTYTLYTHTDAGDVGTSSAFGLHISKNGSWYKHLGSHSPNEFNDFNNFLSSIGLSASTNEDPTIDNVITFTIGHGNQVSYSPNAWGNTGYGTLLPIFCL